MLKLNYFLTDIFILSAEKQPIKLSQRKIEWLHIVSLDTINDEIILCVNDYLIDNTSEIKVKHGNQYPEKQKRLYQAMEDIKNFFSISLFDNDEEKHNDTFLFPKKFDNDICSLLYDNSSLKIRQA